MRRLLTSLVQVTIEPQTREAAFRREGSPDLNPNKNILRMLNPESLVIVWEGH